MAFGKTVMLGASTDCCRISIELPLHISSTLRHGNGVLVSNRSTSVGLEPLCMWNFGYTARESSLALFLGVCCSWSPGPNINVEHQSNL